MPKWLWIVVTLGVTLIILLVIGLAFTPFLSQEDLQFIPQSEALRIELEHRKGWLTGIGGVIVLLGLCIAGWRAEAATRAAQAAADNARAMEAGNIAERFSRAIDQLGARTAPNTSNLEVRLGAIYSLEQIASQNPTEYHWQIIEILAAYLRSNLAPVPPDGPDSILVNRSIHENQPTEDIQAALTAIGRLGPANQQRIKLSHLWLQNAVFPKHSNLSHIILNFSNLRGANLERANLRCAWLGGTWLEGANLESASMQESQLGFSHLGMWKARNTNLRNAKLHRTNFDNAEFRSFVSLSGANLSGAYNLTHTQLCTTSFDETTTLPDGESGRTQEEVCSQRVAVPGLDYSSSHNQGGEAGE